MTNTLSSNLIQLASHCQLDNEELERYLTFLKAPPDFKNAQAAIYGFKRLLTAPAIYEFSQLETDDVFLTNSILEREIENSDELQSFSVKNKSSNAKQLARGMLQEYPEYTLLFFYSKSDHQLIDQLKQLAWVPTDTSKRADIYDYCRFVRALSESTLPKIIVDHLSKPQLSANDVYVAVNEFVNSERRNVNHADFYQKNLIENANAALRYLKSVTNRKVTRKTRTGETKLTECKQSLGVRGFGSLDNKTFVKELVSRDEDDAFDAGRITSYECLDIEPTELSELIDQGVEPAELEKDQKLVWLLDIISPIFAQNFRANVKLKGQVARIERQNQYLTSNVNLLNDIEARTLLRHLENCKVDSHTDAAIALTVLIMLLTSSPFERAKSLTIINSASRNKITEGVGYDFEQNLWVIPRLTLPFATTELHFEEAKRPLNNICLPVLSNRVGQLVKQFFISDKTVSTPLKKLRFTKSQIKNHLRALSERITVTKASDFLMLRLAASNSQSVAGYLFNRACPGSLARYYYSSHSESFLRHKYTHLLNTIFLNDDGKPLEAENHQQKNDGTSGFGARYVPTKESIREAFRLMSSDLYGNWRHLKKHSFIDFHNFYTAYCIYAQSLLVGARAVTDPFVSSKQLIGTTDLAVFRDKDTKDQFHTRILPVHPSAIKIAHLYEKHRLVAIEKAILLTPVFCKHDFLNIDTTFFIDPETKKPLDSRPSHIKRFLRAFSILPINSNRKFLRTFLEAENISPEAIDAALGHASLGERIGDTMSTFSFTELRTELFCALDKLIDEVGLKILKGLDK